MHTTRSLFILTSSAVLTLSALAATPDELQKKAERAIIPKLELKESSPADAFKAITQATGIPISFTPGKAEQPSISLSVSNIPASEALAYVTGLANLKFRYEKDGVSIVPGNAMSNASSSKAPVPLPAPGSAYVVQPAPGAAPRNSVEPLVMREFKINAAMFVRTLRQATPPRQGETDDLLFARFLKERHVDIQALTLNGSSGRMFVRATNPDMQKIAAFVQQIDSGALPPPAAR